MLDHPSAAEIAQALGGNRNGAGWLCRCPAHDDTTPSLSVGDGDNGRPIFHCFAGCEQRAVRDALAARSLWPDEAAMARVSARSKGLTLRAYADAKRLTASFLASLGVREEQGPYGARVVIPYKAENGEERIVRFRIALDGKKRFLWPKGSAGKLCLYGLDRLGEARVQGSVVLVEGESDCQTLWLHGFPGIGVPGAASWRERRDAAALDGVETIYVVDEGDKGSESLRATLAKSAVRHRVRVVVMPEGRASGQRLKDPSALHLDDPEAFRERFETALRAAKPLAEVAPASAAGDKPLPERNDPERAAIAKLADGDAAAFVALLKKDAGFPFEAEALVALNALGSKRPADFERLRAKLKAEAKFSRFAALEAAMKAQAGASGEGDGLPGRPITFEERRYGGAVPASNREASTDAAD
jgi:hypothetical protein